MSSLRFFTDPHRRLMWLLWLLWLLLLLPIAQTTGALHGYSHVLSSEAGGSEQFDGKAHSQRAQCDLCLTAVALIGGAPPAEPPSLPESIAAHKAPNANSGGAWIAPIISAYESRAPPLALR